MARGIKKVRKPKKAKLSKMASNLYKSQLYGDEPHPSQGIEIDRDTHYKILRWHNYMSDAKDARKFINEYLKNKAEFKKKLQGVPDNLLPLTAAWNCRILNLGGILPQSSIEFTNKSIEDSFRYVSDEQLDESASSFVQIKVPSVKDRIKQKAAEISAEIEGLIDDGYTEGLYDLLKELNVSAPVAKHISDHFKPQLEEINMAIEGSDNDLKEGYKHMSAKVKKAHKAMLEGFITDADKIANVKKVMTVRIKKPVPPEKKVKGLKINPDSSIKSVKLLNAQEAWLFNEKTRILTVLRALDRGGIDVKGNSLIGFDESRSESKKIRENKVNETLNDVLTKGKIFRKNIMNNIKSKPSKLQFRGNLFTKIIFLEK